LTNDAQGQEKDERMPAWVGWLPAALRRRVEDSPALQKILGNTSWLMFERIVNMTIRFFVGVWVVRYLGPEQYGVYSYALSYVGMFTALATLGLDNIVIRNLSREGTSREEVLGTALALRIIGAIATIGIVVASVASVADRTLIQVAVIVVAAQLVFKAANVFDLWFQAEIKSKYPVWVRSVVTVLFAGSQVAFILAGFSVLQFVGLVALQSLLEMVGTWVAYRVVSGKNIWSWTINWKSGVSMMRDAWPLIFAGLSVSVYMKIDQVMLGEMVGESAVGIYATAVKISELWYFIPGAIAGSVFPKIVSTKEKETKDVYEKRMQAFYDIFALLSYAVIIPLTLSAEPVIRVLFGAEYAEAATILQVHIWSFLFVSLGTARGRWLVAENFTNFAMISAVAGAVTNVGLNFVLIPAYVGKGAAWATLASQMIAAYLTCLLLPSIRPAFYQMTRAIGIPFRGTGKINEILK
jgi:O-antigen/teichoic acid export membrane protein